MRTCGTSALCLALLALAAPAGAYEVALFPTVADCGGGIAPGPESTLNGSIGQPVAGFVATSGMLHWSGFWAGEFTAPAALAGIGSIKKASAGSYVSLSGVRATSDSEDFSGFFYVEAPDRSSGVRVDALNGMPVGLRRGSAVTAFGTVSVLASGERCLSAPSVTLTARGLAPVPLRLANRSLGGQDLGVPPSAGQYGVVGGYGLNNVGLLVHTWGVVTGKGKGYLWISDGSMYPVRVSTGLLLWGPSVGDTVMVTGISSLYLDTQGVRQRCILVRQSEDIVVL